MKRIFTALIAFVALALTAQAQDKIYWGQVVQGAPNGNPTIIGSVNFDGTNSAAVTPLTSFLYDLEIDFYKGIVYWAENGKGLMKVNTDGSNVQTVVAAPALQMGAVALD
jgi:hypothetical protein